MTATTSPWILSARFDCCFILAPAILISLLVIFFSDSLQALQDMPPWLWLILIVGIDAGHVYGSLFRTYLDEQTLVQQSGLLTLAPVLVWFSGCMLYSIGSLWFWRVLAYLAVFHFIRQQYGFMMIYSRHERNLPMAYRKLDKYTLYAATLCPLIVWHSSGRHFNWFVAEDFIIINDPTISLTAQLIFLILMGCYGVKECLLWYQHKKINLPRNLLIIGTALSWYVGIVAFNNDFIFTATNVIAHGIPYYALIWIYGYKRNRMQRDAYTISLLGSLFRWQMLPLYIALLFLIAYVEEGFWDGLVWREHPSLFTLFNNLPGISSEQTLAWLVPLLTVPQATHYVLDAFIWRLHSKNAEWKKILFHTEDPH
jgi:hypothetical protein